MVPGISGHTQVEVVDGIVEEKAEFDIIYGFPTERSTLLFGGNVVLKMPAYQG